MSFADQNANVEIGDPASTPGNAAQIEPMPQEEPTYAGLSAESPPDEPNAIDVVVLGEILCDLYPVPLGAPAELSRRWELHPGGAPANVAVQLARLGLAVELWTVLGDDPWSRLLTAQLRTEGVGLAGVQSRPGLRAGATLVHCDPQGERSFTALHHQRSDLSFAPEDLAGMDQRRSAWLLHGTVSLSGEPAATATREAVRRTRARGGVVIVDVNLRPGMFHTREAMLEAAWWAIRHADVVKATREEASALVTFLDGSAGDDGELLRRLLRAGPRLVLMSMGPEGALAGAGSVQASLAALPTEVVDATGAGDAFLGAAVSALRSMGVTREQLQTLNVEALQTVLRAGNRAGSAACGAVGATTGMLRLDDLSP